MDINFLTASRFLQRLAVPSFPQAYGRLVELVRVWNMVDAFKTCFPEKWPQQLDSLRLRDLDAERLLILHQAAIPALNGLFPVREDYMDEIVNEDEHEPLQIYPELCGYAWDDEWMSQILEDPSELSPDCALALFFKLLWLITNYFDEEEGRQVWEKGRAHFGYPCDMPGVAKIRNRDFQWERLHELLEAEGLGQFWRASQVALCDTDNLFLDASPDDYGYGSVEIPDFTAHNVLELKKLWAEAEAWLADYEACRKMVEADPGIYIRLTELWKQVCEISATPQPAQTLVEIFKGDMNEPAHPPL